MGFVFARRGDFLAGSFITPEDRTGEFVRMDPADPRRDLGTWPYSGWSVQTAVALARETWPRWGGLDLRTRTRLLRALPVAVDGLAGPLATRISIETGKPPWEARAEVQAALRQMDALVEAAPLALGTREAPSRRGRSSRQGIGVVALLTPFPYPAWLPLSQLMAALLAGNTAILNPSSLTPSCGQLLAEAVSRTRIPRGVVAVLQGPREPIGRLLLEHPGVDLALVSGRPATGASLSGSSQAGRLVLRTSSRSAAAVLDDAPVERAAFEVALGAFLATGQRCNGTALVAVSAGVASRFLVELRSVAASLTCAASLPESQRAEAFLGPLASARDRRAYESWRDHILASGLPVHVAGGIHASPGGGHYALPFVYEGTSHLTGGLVQDLVGPVLHVVVTPSDDEALQAASLPCALSSSVFTASAERFESAVRVLPQGSVNWNRATVVSSGRLPASGPRGTGRSGDGHLDLLRELSRAQAVLDGAALAPDAEEFPPGVGWRPSGATPFEPTRGSTPHGADTTQERAARVVARGTRVRASFSEHT